MAPTSQLGAGFLESSFARGLQLDPHFIACDAGSTDSGPHALATGHGTFPDAGLRRDLRLMLKGAIQLGVPLVIGSCGTSGSDIGVDRVRRIALEIAAAEDLHFRLAVIRSEQDPASLKRRYLENRVRPLDPAPEIAAETFDRCERIVAMMGREPISRAIEGGADVILCGRASDAALFAAYPCLYGLDPGPVWHAAKIIECGAACVVSRKRPDSIFAWIGDDHFEVEPLDPENRVTPQSVASHALYETANPFLITEPGGVLDTQAAVYEQTAPRRVRVSGSRFRMSPEYTVKLEGVASLGWQHIIVAGVSDPYILGQLDNWIDGMTAKMRERVGELFGGTVCDKDYSIHVRVYGRDGVMGPLTPPETAQATPGEIGLVFTITAPSEEASYTIAKAFSHLASHYPIPEWTGLITGLAFPFSPAAISRGPAHVFTLNHVVLPDDPYELFPMTLEEV